MRFYNLFDSELSPAEPIRRCVDRSGASPALSFSHPAKQHCRWRAIIPLGTKDFYDTTEPCPTWPDRDGKNCRYCGQTLQGDKCHGVVPKIPPLDTAYDLIGTGTQDTSLLLAIKQKRDVPGSLILWDDNGLGDSVSYIVSGKAKILTYGHSLEHEEAATPGNDDGVPATITVFPVVLVSGAATLVSTALIAHNQSEINVYGFDEHGQFIKE
jgi:hypothetical protein